MPRLLLALLAASAVASADALYVMETGTRDLYAQEWTSDFDFYFVADGWALCSGAPEDAAGLRFATLLDPSFRDPGDYAVVHAASPRGAVSAVGIGTPLYQNGDVTVVELSTSPASLPALPGIRLVQPLRETVLQAPVELYMPARDGGMDGFVADIVSIVDETSFQTTIQDMQDCLTRYSSTDGYDTAALYVQDRFGDYGIPAELQYFDMGSYDCENVIGEIQGIEDSTKIVIICGHLDSTSPQSTTNAPGADDNASGSAAVVEAARAMSGFYFANTVRFVCFGGEEQGLYGSAYYADQCAAAGDDIIAVLNFDMILYGPSGDASMWVPYNTSSNGLALAFDAICDTYVPALDVITEYSPGTTYSDHASFWNQGYPAILGIENAFNDNPYYHQTSDVLANYMSYFPFGTDCARGAIAAAAYFAEPLGGYGIEDEGSGAVPGSFVITGVGPNPSTGLVTFGVSSSLAGPSYSVYDISGRVALRGGLEGEGTSFSIDVSALPAGVFVLEASSGGSSDTAVFTVLR